MNFSGSNINFVVTEVITEEIDLTGKLTLACRTKIGATVMNFKAETEKSYSAVLTT